MTEISPRVLVVEDEEIAQIAARRFLQDYLGCQVDVVPTGHEALDLVHQTHYDMIFMDLGIFDMDGFNITKKIRSLGNKMKDVPIVAVTAYHHDSMRKRASTIGINDFIVKPLTLEHCHELLKKYKLKNE